MSAAAPPPPRLAALSIAVGLVLADSSIVVLALPDIYRELDTGVGGVTWVLISFNLTMALLAVPGAYLARRVGPGRAAAVGLAVFAGAGLACGLAADLGTLVAARCVQALGGAVAVTAVLELLPTELARSERHDLVPASGARAGSGMATVGSERRAVEVWAVAGATGAALGPAVGGVLTELVSWQSIFLLQAPAALAVAAPILIGMAGERKPSLARTQGGRIAETYLADRGQSQATVCSRPRPHLLANAALAMVSAAIAAALFLLVLLLIEGWRLTPIAAAMVVTAMPLSAVLGARLGAPVPSARARAAAGAILVAGGLGGLALLPEADVALTLPPQVLVGIGLALVLAALTETALAGRSPQAIHGGWTISARHAGVAIGLIAVTPLFTAEIAEQRREALDAGTAVILDSPVDPLRKLELSQRLSERLEEERGKVPTLGSVFEPLPEDEEDRAEVLLLREELQDQLDRGATSAFSLPFGLGALIGLLALVPIGLARRVEL